MSKKDDRKARLKEREDAILAKAEKLKGQEKLSFDEKKILAQAAVIKLERAVDANKLVVLAHKEGLAKINVVGESHRLEDAVKVGKCACCGSTNPTRILPWSVGMALLQENGQWEKTNGDFNAQLASLEVEHVSTFLFCPTCGEDVEEVIAEQPLAAEHSANGRLHDRDTAVKFWAESRARFKLEKAEIEKVEVENELKQLEAQLVRARKYAQSITDEEEAEAKKAEAVAAEVAARKKKITGMFAGLGKAA